MSPIIAGNNEVMSSVYVGHYKGLVLKPDGSTMDLTLKDVLYIPKLIVNLVPLTKSLETKGLQLSSEEQLIYLNIGTYEIFFDKDFKHCSKRLLGIEIHPNPNHIAATAQNLDNNMVHKMFGHPNSQVLAATAAKYGHKTKNTLAVCSNCAVAKAKEKILNKTNSNASTELGGRININISSVLNLSYGGANFWLLVQDDFTNYLWIHFRKAKNDLPETMIDWLQLVKKELSLDVKCICLYHSGENTAFQKLVQYKSEFNIKI
jgi:hypothetical protein